MLPLTGCRSIGAIAAVAAFLAISIGPAFAQERLDPTKEAIARAPYHLRLRSVLLTTGSEKQSVSTCQVTAEVIAVTRAPSQAGIGPGSRLKASVPCRDDMVRYGGAVGVSSLRPDQIFDVALVDLSSGELRMIPSSLRRVQ